MHWQFCSIRSRLVKFVGNSEWGGLYRHDEIRVKIINISILTNEHIFDILIKSCLGKNWFKTSNNLPWRCNLSIRNAYAADSFNELWIFRNFRRGKNSIRIVEFPREIFRYFFVRWKTLFVFLVDKTLSEECDVCFTNVRVGKRSWNMIVFAKFKYNEPENSIWIVGIIIFYSLIIIRFVLHICMEII